MPPSSKQAETPALKFTQGDANWRAYRKRYTESVPSKYSSLYMLNAELLGHGPLVPMTYKAHWAMCLFAEGMTGIPEIDNARVKMVLVPRGIGKSTLVTKGLAIHKLLKHDDCALGIANETQDGANDFVEMVKAEFETNEQLQQLFPERIPDFKNTTWKTDEIVIARKKPRPKSPSMLASGVGSTKTGVHMDTWILDDILSQNAAENALAGSFSEIQSTNRWVGRIQPMLCAPKRDPIYIIGTRWWQGDTYEWMEGTEEEPGYWGHGEKKQEFRWTLKLPDNTWQTITVYRRGELAVFCRPAIEDGQSIFPERYTLEELAVMEMEDPHFFAGQYMLNPTGGKAQEFKDDWLGTYVFDGQACRFIDDTGKVTFVPFSEMTFLASLDPAFAKKNPQACKTAIPITAVWRDRVFLIEDFAEKHMGNHEIAQKVVDFRLRYPFGKIKVESIAAQAAVAEEVNRQLKNSGLPFVEVEEIPNHKQAKPVRIYGMQSIFKTRRFLIRHDQKNFRSEYAGFPRSSQRDLLDALAFQKSEWEKIIQYGVPSPTSQLSNQHIAGDIERIRRNLNPRRAA